MLRFQISVIVVNAIITANVVRCPNLENCILKIQIKVFVSKVGLVSHFKNFVINLHKSFLS